LSVGLGPVKGAPTAAQHLGWQNEQRSDKSKLSPYTMSGTLADADTRPIGSQTTLELHLH